MSRNGNPLGNLKGKLAVEPVWKLLMTSVMARSTHESPPIQSQTSINGALPVFVLAFFIQTLFWFIFLAIFISVSQVCKIFHNSPWGGYYSSTKSKSSFENVSMSPFFIFPFWYQVVQLKNVLYFELLSLMNYESSRISIFEKTRFMSLFLMTQKSIRRRSLPILDTCLLIFMVTPEELIVR